jgi:saccharopine dehydrogenase-like NADP-dependent oxidoreductase
MSTMKVKHEAEALGYKVTGYESWCGGIPVAEQATSNPLGYKFSWNPGAGIKASKNKAIYLKNGKRVETDEPLKMVENKDDFSMSMKLEAYPNRDSFVFQDKFEMHDCHTFVRGSIRYQGFSAIISAFHDVGLTSDTDIVPSHVRTINEMTEVRIRHGNIAVVSHMADQAISSV